MTLAEAFAMRPRRASAPRALRIGVLNNMPDAALLATERQFSGLIGEAAGGRDIELGWFALAGVERGERARAAMVGRYADARTLPDANLDGLIVTGAEPRAPELDAEPYWQALTWVIDWTQAAAIPTVWSCLAAHAAVLHLDGARRRRLPAKLSGVFVSDRAAGDLLLAGAPMRLVSPHSRLNGLLEDDLVAAGYRILTRSPEAGVDAFARRGPALALFFQGHPEYDANSLAREFSRDIARFLNGERGALPAPPSRYFDAATEARLARLADRVQRGARGDVIEQYREALARAGTSFSWRSSAVSLYRNWLAEAARTDRSPATAIAATA